MRVFGIDCGAEFALKLLFIFPGDIEALLCWPRHRLVVYAEHFSEQMVPRHCIERLNRVAGTPAPVGGDAPPCDAVATGFDQKRISTVVVLFE